MPSMITDVELTDDEAGDILAYAQTLVVHFINNVTYYLLTFSKN